VQLVAEPGARVVDEQLRSPFGPVAASPVTVDFPVLDTGTPIAAGSPTGAVAVPLAPAALPLTVGVPVETTQAQPASVVVPAVDVVALLPEVSGAAVWTGCGAVVVCSAVGAGADCEVGATVVLVVVVVEFIIGVLGAGVGPVVLPVRPVSVEVRLPRAPLPSST
jgi:hypothetical protein